MSAPSDPSDIITREELIAMAEKFREVKHSVNNSLAVMMALSELAQRNPQHYEKLTKTVLTRSPDIVTQLQEFGKILTDRAKPPGGG